MLCVWKFMDDSLSPEHDLIVSLKCGSVEAFNLLFYKYETLLFAFAMKLLRSSEDAEEVVQEVFYKIWKNKHLLDEQKSFKAFIFTIAKNYMYNLLAKKVSETTYKHYYTTHTQNKVSSTEENLNVQDLNHTIRQVLRQMPKKRKQVFMMSRYEGLNNKEIASRLHISLSTVENHINKALKELKKHLSFHEVSLLLILLYL